MIRLVRFVAIFLVPCLIVDPGTAACLRSEFSQVPETAAVAPTQEIFKEQAFSPVAFWVEHVLASLPKMGQTRHAIVASERTANRRLTQASMPPPLRGRFPRRTEPEVQSLGRWKADAKRTVTRK